MLDYLIIIPNFISPFKVDNPEELFKVDRIAIINSYLNSLDPVLQSKIKILDYEINKNEVSYTFDTIEYIKYNIQNILNIEYNDSIQFQYYFLIGDDNLLNFDKWKNWENIFDLTNLIVAFRLENKESIVNLINQKYSTYSSKIQILENPIYEISATEIRRNIDELNQYFDNRKYSELLKLINEYTLDNYFHNKNPL